MADITAILSATPSPDANTRQAAGAQLKQAQEQNLGAFLQSLANEVATEAKPLDSRRLAGLILKNALDAKDEALKARAALDAFPASAYRDALTGLADYAVSRVS